MKYFVDERRGLHHEVLAKVAQKLWADNSSKDNISKIDQSDIVHVLLWSKIRKRVNVVFEDTF